MCIGLNTKPGIKVEQVLKNSYKWRDKSEYKSLIWWWNLYFYCSRCLIILIECYLHIWQQATYSILIFLSMSCLLFIQFTSLWKIYIFMDSLKASTNIWFACLLYSYAKTTIGTETWRHLIIIQISVVYTKIDEFQIIKFPQKSFIVQSYIKISEKNKSKMSIGPLLTCWCLNVTFSSRMSWSPMGFYSSQPMPKWVNVRPCPISSLGILLKVS